MEKFKVNQVLTSRSICNYDVIYRAVVISRTAKTVTIIEDGQQKRCKVHEHDGAEMIFPHGRYSMAATFRANRQPEFNAA